MPVPAENDLEGGGASSDRLEPRDAERDDGGVLRGQALISFGAWPRLTPRERAEAYNRTFPTWPPLVATDRWLYGIWGFGNNYRGSGFYGSYPPTYLRRVAALFPDRTPEWRVLHAFSGSLRADCEVPGVRLDLVADIVRTPDLRADVRRLPFAAGTFDLILADTPYGPAHAVRYGTKMPDRRSVTRELARVAKPGGHLVWLDTKRPMYRKALWHEWGHVGCFGSTNHDIRGVCIFSRTEAPLGET